LRRKIGDARFFARILSRKIVREEFFARYKCVCAEFAVRAVRRFCRKIALFTLFQRRKIAPCFARGVLLFCEQIGRYPAFYPRRLSPLAHDLSRSSSLSQRHLFLPQYRARRICRPRRLPRERARSISRPRTTVRKAPPHRPQA